jgi:hypothetical protein
MTTRTGDCAGDAKKSRRRMMRGQRISGQDREGQRVPGPHTVRARFVSGRGESCSLYGGKGKSRASSIEGRPDMKERGRRTSALHRAKRRARKFSKQKQAGNLRPSQIFKPKPWPRSLFVVVPGAGIPCPRCRRPTQIREHGQITERHRRQPYYFTRWFRCMHRDCHTTLIMSNQFKVWPGRPKAP